MMAMLESLFERRLGPMETRFDAFTQRLDKVADRVEHLDQVVLNTEQDWDEEEEEEDMRINDDYADHPL